MEIDKVHRAGEAPYRHGNAVGRRPGALLLCGVLDDSAHVSVEERCSARWGPRVGLMHSSSSARVSHLLLIRAMDKNANYGEVSTEFPFL